MMVAALKEETQVSPQPRVQVDLAAKEAIAAKTVPDFVTPASLRIATAFDVFMDFPGKDPSECKDDASFQSSQQILCEIATVND